MLAAVLHARGQRLLRRLARISVFGDGLLERARSTSFALLGGIAAIGLAIVAFALQLGWPIGADRPLPSAPQKRQAVGAGVAVGAAPSRPVAARRKRSRGAATRGALARRDVTPAVDAAGAHPAPTSDQVVSDSEPAPPRHRHPRGHEETPQGQTPPAPQAPPEGTGASKPQPPSQPQPVPAPQPEPPPEPEAEASDVPGVGHAYGKGNGNGPPAPPPAVGNPHAPDAGSFAGRSGDPPCHDDH